MIRKLLDGLMDFALIALGIPAAIAESAINRRSWTDRIADRVVERMQAQQPHASHNFHIVNNATGLDSDARKAAEKRLIAAQGELARAQIKDHRRGA